MPVATRVPQIRRVVPLGAPVQVGKAVAARQWSELGPLVNYLRGKGAVLVPGHSPMVGVDAGISTGFPAFQALVYRTRPSGRAILRVWAVEVLGVPSGSATITPSGGSAFLVSAGPATTAPNRVFVLTEPATKTTAITGLGLSVQAVSGAVQVVGVTCWELSRAQLSRDATDLGIDLGSLDAGRPILDRPYESVAGVARALGAADGRRVGLASWCGEPILVTSGTFVGMFALPLRIVPPRVGPNDTTRGCSWNVLAFCDVGTTGEARVLTDTGATSAALAITATSATWLDGTVAVRCEDRTTSDGLPGGTWPTAQLQVRRVSGAGNVRIQGFNIYDGLW